MKKDLKRIIKYFSSSINIQNGRQQILNLVSNCGFLSWNRIYFPGCHCLIQFTNYIPALSLEKTMYGYLKREKKSVSWIKILKEIFCPQDMIGLLRSNLGIFLLQKFGVVWVYIDWGCNLAAHSSIHASFILRRGLTRFQLPKWFLSRRIIECRNSSDILQWGPGWQPPLRPPTSVGRS